MVICKCYYKYLDGQLLESVAFKSITKQLMIYQKKTKNHGDAYISWSCFVCVKIVIHLNISSQLNMSITALGFDCQNGFRIQSIHITATQLR